jgi:ribonuclease G
VEKELIIDSAPADVKIAILEDSRLTELHKQRNNSRFSVGDIFLGKVRKIMPGLNAAFVDIGHRKDAFLHYTDLGPQYRSLQKFAWEANNNRNKYPTLNHFETLPDIYKNGKIKDVLDRQKPILVQILKEPISTKGPRLSCEVTIPGRFMVMTPFNDVIAVSKKISNEEERKRLYRLVESIKPRHFGIIVRTAAEGKKVADLHEEMLNMMSKWAEMQKQIFKARAPKKIFAELDKTSTLLRDVLNDSFSKIVVNDKEMYNNVKGYLKSISPDKLKILSEHKSKRPIFDAFGITKQIKSSFGKIATVNSGAYIVIEGTEAMHVIDVNSGHNVINAGQSEAAYSVNMEAAKEISRQLRLRDIGGLIIIDFIDMKKIDHKKLLLKNMRDFMMEDRAQHTILPLSKFGLMQITRQRVRPEVKINTDEKCPNCKGTGKVAASILVTEDIERDLEYITQSHPNSKITLTVHPYLEAYLNRGWFGKKWEWFRKHGKWIKIHGNYDFQLLTYKFTDESDEEIRLN